ncbi:hypothetical protein MJO29_012589 [Puccinia striiformis f. sp. tritici]|nr:hypothetical protein MJO29_012589 [Puccinia striiformis f. sp. tritici]
MAGNIKKRTGKLKMKTPTIATRAQRLRCEKNRVENHSSYLRIFANQDSLRRERERQEDMIGDHLMENTYEPNPEQIEDDAASSSSEDDVQWVNVELEPPRPIDLAIEACKEQFRREARELNWSNVTQLLHPAFMTMKSRTNNWSRTLEINPMPKCICSSTEKKTRIVDLVDIFGQYRKPFEFCKCTNDAARLIYHGYLAASPQIPQTAFSLPLLTFHNSLWNHCHARDLHKPFSAAVDFYRELEELSTKLAGSGEKRSLPLALLRKLFLDVEPDRKVGILYDIGCSLDKFCQLRELLIEERPRIHFGTSVFHAYAHNWLCQLGYHPRFNVTSAAFNHTSIEAPQLARCQETVKFNAAITRRIQTRLILQQLLRQQNPFDSQGRNYKKSFFKQQWTSQREFRHNRTGPEDERRCKLVELYEKEATVARLRKELSSPKVLQRTEEELADLIKNIQTGTEEVQLLKEELTEEEGVPIDDKEQRLLLLLWSAKTDLFLQASYKQAETQPITDSQTIGTRLGTKGREKVFQALRDRESTVARALNLYNKRYADYVAEYPDKAPATQYEHPISYDEFSIFPLDDAFWNDGIYYQSKEPWAIDPNVCSGINCVLILSRIQEEFQLIAQELARMVEWAISHYHTLYKSINYLRGRIVQMSIPNTVVPPDYIDEIPFGDGKCSRVLKVTYIKQDLQQRAWEHGTLMV